MASSARRIASGLVGTDRRLTALERAPQLGQSTVDPDGAEGVPVAGALAAGQGAADALPGVVESADVAQGGADSADLAADVAQESADFGADALEEARTEIESYLDTLAVDLDAAGGRLDDAQGRIDSAFSELNGVKTVASTAQNVALAADARALAAAGLAGGKGRVWFQPGKPEAGRAHQWLGDANSSSSVESLNGVEARRNRMPDPAPMSGGIWGSSGLTSGQIVDQPALPSKRAYRAGFGSNAGGWYVMVNQNSPVPVAEGEHFESSIWGMHTWSGGVVQMTVQFFDGNGGTIGYFAGTGSHTVQAGVPTRIAFSAVVPAGARSAVMFWDSSVGGTRPSASDYAYVGSAMAGAPGDYFDGSTPDDRVADLWIDTDDGNRTYRWDSDANDWAVYNDQRVTDAANSAVEAQNNAENALNLAKDAQSAADSKPSLRSGTTVPTDTQPAGSTYFRVNSGGDIVSQYQQTTAPSGNTWTSRLITSDAVATLDVGKLRALDAVIADAVIGKIAAQSASIQTVDIKNLFVTGTASLNEAVVNRIFAEVVKAKTVTATEAFIGGSAIIDGAVTARTLSATAVDGKTITGALIRTAASGPRLEFTETRIVGYAGTNAAEFARLDPSGGGLLRMSNLASGSTTINGVNWYGGGAIFTHPLHTATTDLIRAAGIGWDQPFDTNQANLIYGTPTLIAGQGYPAWLGMKLTADGAVNLGTPNGSNLRLDGGLTYSSAGGSLASQAMTTIASGNILMDSGRSDADPTTRPGQFYLRPDFAQINTRSGVALTLNAAQIAMINAGKNILIDSAGQLISTAAADATTSTAGNMNINTAGLIRRSTSALKYKENVEEYGYEDPYAVLGLRSYQWTDKAERIAAEDTGDDISDLPKYVGTIADYAIGVVPELVGLGEDGLPDDFDYSRLALRLIPVLRDLNARLTAANL